VTVEKKRPKKTQEGKGKENGRKGGKKMEEEGKEKW
jgi:hypothetical protein